ncbi:MAG: LemA family protein [Acidimicrobiia bacterium]
MNSRPRWLVPVAVAVGVLLLLVLPLVAVYNGLVDKETAVEQSFADLDVQLTRRSDLIPNLVDATRGIFAQERAVFDALAEARSNYLNASPGSSDQAAASDELSGALSQFLVVVESYPDLRSNENVLALQDQLEGTENRIAQARRDYNGVVTTYNRSVRRFPRSVLAGVFGFDRKPLFEADADDRENPSVDLETDLGGG